MTMQTSSIGRTERRDAEKFAGLLKSRYLSIMPARYLAFIADDPAAPIPGDEHGQLARAVWQVLTEPRVLSNRAIKPASPLKRAERVVNAAAHEVYGVATYRSGVESGAIDVGAVRAALGGE